MFHNTLTTIPYSILSDSVEYGTKGNTTESGPKPNYTVEVGMIWAPQWGEDYQTDGGEWRLLFASVFTQHC